MHSCGALSNFEHHTVPKHQHRNQCSSRNDRISSRKMDQFAPHPSACFEGWYSKFDLPSGSHVVLVICTVPKASTLPPHMVSFTYYPASGTPIFQREHWVSQIERITDGPNNAFELKTDFGSMYVASNGDTTYSLEAPEWSLNATATSRTP